MIDFNKPVQTRDGRKVRILCTDGQDAAYPVVGFIAGNLSVSEWTSCGTYNNGSRVVGCADLINVPERVERILVVDGMSGHLVQYRPQDLRDIWKALPRIRITYEDGKPVAVALEDCK